MQKLLQKTRGDQVIWAVVILLSLISLLAVYSSTQSLAYRMDKNASYYLFKQLFFLGLGLVVIYVVHKVNYTKLVRFTTIVYAISIPLLIYTIFFGVELNKGSRWIMLPVVNVSFQTSDLAKLALFVFLARILSIKQHVIKDFKKGFVPVLIPVVLTCGLIMPENLSTALMLCFTCSILFYIGRVKVSHILILGLAGILCLALVYTVSKITGKGRATTWEQRIASYTGGKKDPNAKHHDDFQITQAKIAIASGGIFGQGPGHSQAKDFLPHGYSDFIYANIIAEYGIIGGAVVVFLYLLFLWRSILIFKRCPFAFGAFLAVGLSITLVFQAMLNMAVNVHLVPVTGLTLPMISMGGSSIWFTSIAIGLILSVSRYVEEEAGATGKKAKKAIEEESAPTSINTKKQTLEPAI